MKSFINSRGGELVACCVSVIRFGVWLRGVGVSEWGGLFWEGAGVLEQCRGGRPLLAVVVGFASGSVGEGW